MRNSDTDGSFVDGKRDEPFTKRTRKIAGPVPTAGAELAAAAAAATKEGGGIVVDPFRVQELIGKTQERSIKVKFTYILLFCDVHACYTWNVVCAHM